MVMRSRNTALLSLAVETGRAGVLLNERDWGQTGLHLLLPSLPDGQAVLIAAGMLGATVMPHVIYLHSQLVQSRNGSSNEEERRKHLRMERIDITIAMNIAFVINAAMVIVSASVFHRNGLTVSFDPWQGNLDRNFQRFLGREGWLNCLTNDHPELITSRSVGFLPSLS
jgi:manganese transport protein